MLATASSPPRAGRRTTSTLRALDLGACGSSRPAPPPSSTPISGVTACCSGLNLEQTLDLAFQLSTPVIASGGVGSLDDLRALKTAGRRLQPRAQSTASSSAGRLYDGQPRPCPMRWSCWPLSWHAVLKLRVIPCLDVKDGRVVKGVNFVGLRDAGDPVEQAAVLRRRPAPTNSPSSTSPPAMKTVILSWTWSAAPPHNVFLPLPSAAAFAIRRRHAPAAARRCRQMLDQLRRRGAAGPISSPRRRRNSAANAWWSR